MNLEEVLQFRRAVRVYDPEKPIDPAKVKKCIELATLAPTSSNMQLWEFYHVTDKKVMAELSKASLSQLATETADQLVVFVTRQDLHKERAKYILKFEEENIKRYSPADRQESRMKDRLMYYGKIMPFLYSRFCGLIGAIRWTIVSTVGLFRPITRQVREKDVRVVVHKSCALAAQTFMIAMANEGFDTCPLEGFDSKLVKKALNLPRGAEVNMIISCGIRNGTEGIWGERCRVPFESVIIPFNWK